MTNPPITATAPVAEKKGTGRGSRTFDSFHVPQYRLFWSAIMAQMGAMNMQMVARAWLVYELTNSYAMLGIIGLAGAVPMLGLSLFGGVLADRVPKKRLLRDGQWGLGAVAIATAIGVVVGIIDLEKGTGVTFLIITSVVQGIISGLMMPARQAIIPEIVGPARLMNAVALNQAGMNLNRLVAPGIAGLLIAIMGVGPVFFAIGGLELLGGLLAALLRSTGTMPLGGRGAWREMGDGLRYVRDNTAVMGLLFLALLSVLLSMPYIALMPAFAKDVQVVHSGEYTWVGSIPLLGSVPELLTKSSFRFGLLTSISGVGALVGSLLVASMLGGKRGNAFIWSILGTGVFVALYSFTGSFALAIVFMIGMGFVQSARMALANVLVQDAIDDAHRGRVMAIFMMEFGLSSFSSFAVALLAGAVGIKWAVGGAAILLVPVALYYYFFVPSIRRMK
ncbi:MAG: MFS transporter [Chloroflexi bacterium]|nr:MFS transporter [Chloroflexota bacterium]